MAGESAKRLTAFGMVILREAISVYWTLIKIMLPVMVLTQLAIEMGLIKAISPAFAPSCSSWGCLRRQVLSGR